MCFSLFMATRIHSIRKSTKNRNFETRWKVTQIIQLFKAQKRETKLTNKKVCSKKRKYVQKRNWFVKMIDKDFENNINNAIGELAFSETVGCTFWCMFIIAVDTFFQQAVKNCWIYSRSRIIRKNLSWMT